MGFGSTPTFELFRRGLEPRSIKKFRGINTYKALTDLGPENAINCLNVFAPGWGGLTKMRLFQQISTTIVTSGPSPNQFFDFQQNNGTRQVFADLGNSLYYYTWNGAGTFLNLNFIETSSSDAPPWSFVDANNILFGANGQRMMKWTGANWWLWGIVAPATVPNAQFFGGASLSSIQRAANVVTFSIKVSGPEHSAAYFAVGDTIIVNNPSDGSFNGTFTIASIVTPGLTYTYAQAAANAGPFSTASITYATSSGVIGGVVATRTAGVTTYSFPQPFPVDSNRWPGVTVVMSGWADPTFNGTFHAISGAQAFGQTVSINVAQPGLPDGSAAGTGTVTTGVNVTFSKSYAYTYTNSTTSHQSNLSPIATIIGPLTNRVVYVQAVASADPQVNNVFQWYATLDGGGNFYQDGPLMTSGSPVLRDFYPDGNLNTLVQGPLLNNPPPIGLHLAVGQSRVFIANLVGAPNQIAYSGYEQILVGRPEESFPPNNRLSLNIGAEAINGIGVLDQGVVAFSATHKMYMLRGLVEDITLNAPVQFSAYLKELPWKIGTMCHDSIQATPYGLVFLGTDKTVQLFDGYSTLSDISRPVYSILQRMTVGLESQAKSAYFNWLNLDMYALTFPIDGSTSNNYTLFWVLNKDTMEIDVFPCNLPMTSVGTLTTPNFQRILVVGNNGTFYNLPMSQDTVNGIVGPNPIPLTGGSLQAFWQGGYAGNNTPQRSEMFRWGRLITDADPTKYSVTIRFVNDIDNPIYNPLVVGPTKLQSTRFGINYRSQRCSIEIDFDPIDYSQNVLEYQINSIPTSDR